HATADFPIGMIPIDAIYSPITNVVYSVEPFRVGQKTDYERLVLEVKTDGTVDPIQAVEHAARLLMDHIKLFGALRASGDGWDQQQVQAPAKAEAPKETAVPSDLLRLRRILQTPVEELELSVRAHNCLRAANIKTVADLVSKREQELLKYRNFGRKSLAEVAEIIQNLGLSFGMDVEKYLNEDRPAGA
ncbi:MAG: hypothetical protein D6747_05220, partial [Chlorobiota bacterium]